MSHSAQRPSSNPFPQTRGAGARFTHPVWPASLPVVGTEAKALRRTLAATLGFRQGWVRRKD